MRTNRSNILVHPAVVVKLIDHSIQYGVEPKKVIKDRTYAITREAWISAVFLLGLKEITKQMWWLRVNPEENSAEDIYASSYKPINESGSIQYVLSIQVFQHTAYNKGSVIEGIKKKLKKTDLSNCVLVCYLIKDEFLEWKKLHEEIKKLKPSASEIWIIGNIGNRKMIIFQVYPYLNHAEIDINAVSISKNEPKFIKPYQVSKKESLKKGTYIHPLGKVVVLKPDFSFSDLV